MQLRGPVKQLLQISSGGQQQPTTAVTAACWSPNGVKLAVALTASASGGGKTQQPQQPLLLIHDAGGERKDKFATKPVFACSSLMHKMPFS